ncbi:hypothetical protein [Methyloraptor flagellatus]|jgi:hypothetical protein|uniref:Uncharacterized protein n=1 Tax=Methyloraptor flagellatus TaxID=3162530 RepID=A0AAU7X7F5_9HYPH
MPNQSMAPIRGDGKTPGEICAARTTKEILDKRVDEGSEQSFPASDPSVTSQPGAGKGLTEALEPPTVGGENPR